MDPPVALTACSSVVAPSTGVCSTSDAVSAAMPAFPDGCCTSPAGTKICALTSGKSGAGWLAMMTPLRSVTCVAGANAIPAGAGTVV